MSETNLPPEDTDAATEDGFERKQELLDRFRGTGVGVEDPNIAGTPEPTDVPPGGDPDGTPRGS